MIVDRHGERVDALLLTGGHTGRNAGGWPGINRHWRGQLIHIEIVVVVVEVIIVHIVDVVAIDIIDIVGVVDVVDTLKHQTIRMTISFLARRGANQ